MTPETPDLQTVALRLEPLAAASPNTRSVTVFKFGR